MAVQNVESPSVLCHLRYLQRSVDAEYSFIYIQSMYTILMRFVRKPSLAFTQFPRVTPQAASDSESEVK